MYEFCWEASEALGACHGLDASVLFGTTDSPAARATVGERPIDEAEVAPRRTRPLAARLLANQALLEPDEQLAPVLHAARSWRTDRPAARRLDDDELRRVAVPVQLLIAGRSSLLQPARALARARNLIPGVRAEIVPGAGHGLSLERPDFVSRRVLDFVAAVDAADAGSMVQ